MPQCEKMWCMRCVVRTDPPRDARNRVEEKDPPRCTGKMRHMNFDPKQVWCAWLFVVASNPHRHLRSPIGRTKHPRKGSITPRTARNTRMGLGRRLEREWGRTPAPTWWGRTLTGSPLERRVADSIKPLRRRGGEQPQG